VSVVSVWENLELARGSENKNKFVKKLFNNSVGDEAVYFSDRLQSIVLKEGRQDLVDKIRAILKFYIADVDFEDIDLDQSMLYKEESDILDEMIRESSMDFMSNISQVSLLKKFGAKSITVDMSDNKCELYCRDIDADRDIFAFQSEKAKNVVLGEGVKWYPGAVYYRKVRPALSGFRTVKL
jgi:uncharacterized protein YbcI